MSTDVGESLQRFRLTAGPAALGRMCQEDTARLCGPRQGRAGRRTGYRWGETSGRLGFHGAKAAVRRWTAVTRLGEAGVDNKGIAAITGHSLVTVNMILARYLIITDALATGAFKQRLEHEKSGKKLDN